MSAREDLYARAQQQRWMRPDAHRWVRLDALRYLAPGSDPAVAFPALDCKYSPSQPRTAAGNGRESGRWTDASGSGGNGSAVSPMGNIDPSNLSEIGNLGLFEITPSEQDNSDYMQLAGDVPDGDSPGIGHNQGPPLEPPEIPQKMPETTDERMGFIRKAAEWVRIAGRYTPLVGTYFEALDQIEEIKRLTDIIKSANDQSATLEELQARVNPISESGYHDHHIDERGTMKLLGYSTAEINGSNNVVRIPVLRHIDITAWYATPNSDYNGLSPRDYLRSQPQDVRRQVGLDVLARSGVLKP